MRTAFFILLLALGYRTVAQETKLVGVGSSNGGHIFMFDEDSPNPEIIYSFNETANANPFGALTEFGNRLWGLAGDNIFFGESGPYEQGAIYSMAKDGTDFRVEFDFNVGGAFSTGNGRDPQGTLIEYDNKLWGVTYTQGDNGEGSIFSFDPVSKEHTVEYSFKKSTGYLPLGSMILFDDALYGVTWTGGSTGTYGVIFRFDLVLKNYTMLMEFPSNLKIAGPGGERISIFNDRIWGFSKDKGVNQSKGFLYSLELDGTDFKEEYEFVYLSDSSYYQGYNPWGSPLYLNDRIYGITQNGGEYNNGVIFSMNPDGTDYQFLHQFDGTDGRLPLGSPVLHQGRLYGIAQLGGNNGEGTIFSILPDGTDFKVHYDFQDSLGARPVGDFIIIDNVIWGTTLEGNDESANRFGDVFGIVYSFNLNSGEFKVYHKFNPESGRDPSSSLVIKNDKLWGTTASGGEVEDGTIYSFDLATRTKRSVHQFSYFNYPCLCDNPEFPIGGLTIVDSLFLGMSQQGGTNDRGSVYRFEEDSINFTVTTHLNNDAAYPLGSLIESNNRLWGMAQTDGSNGRGGIFSLNTLGNDYRLEHDFIQGAYPYASLVEANGYLWGTTYSGGDYGEGVIFRIDTTGANYQIVHDFGTTPGLYPYCTLLAYKDKLYGTTAYGGTNGNGIIFSIDTTGTNYVILHDFDETNGSLPTGELIQLNNKLWGQTKRGGSEDLGVIFRINPDGTSFEKAFDLTEETGGSPYNAKLTVVQLKAQQNLAITVEDKIYGAEPFEIEAMSSTENPISYYSLTPDIIEIQDNIVTIKSAGAASVFIVQESSEQYYKAQVTTNFNIEKAELEVIADDKTITYGENEPTYTFSYSGFVNGEDKTIIDTEPSGVEPITTVADAGTYILEVTQDGGDNNYVFTYVDGTLTIDKAPQTITFIELEDVNDEGSTIVLDGTSSSLLDVVFSVVGPVTLNVSSLTTTGAGEVTITASQQGNNNFLAAEDVVQNFCVNPTPIITFETIGVEFVTLSSNYSTGNQWYQGEVLISGATDQTLDIDKVGPYHVAVTIDGCIGISDEVPVVLTNIQDNTFEENLNIYPIPVENQLQIELPNIKKGKYALQMIDVNGKMWKNTSVNVGVSGGLEYKMDVQSLPRGTYMFVIKGNNNMTMKKLFKN